MSGIISITSRRLPRNVLSLGMQAARSQEVSKFYLKEPAIHKCGWNYIGDCIWKEGKEGCVLWSKGGFKGVVLFILRQQVWMKKRKKNLSIQMDYVMWKSDIFEKQKNKWPNGNPRMNCWLMLKLYIQITWLEFWLNNDKHLYFI